MVKKKPQFVLIKDRALAARIHRKLMKEGQQLCKCRPGTATHKQLGDYYIVDQFQALLSTHQDLETLGRKMGMLKPYEKLED